MAAENFAMRISGKLEAMLKKPLGKVVPFAKAQVLVRGKRIIAVGDETVFKFLEAGTVPFVSVFDFKTLRVPVRNEVESRIGEAYPAPIRIEKPAGELNPEMFGVAREMLKKGGGLLVIGEEDLFALPFALLISEGEAVVYGQPGKGCVVLEMGSFKDKGIKEKLNEAGLMLPDGE